MTKNKTAPSSESIPTKRYFLSAEITPEEIAAADSAEFVIRLVVGPGFPKTASRLCYDFSAMLGTSCPTFLVNEESGYVEVYVNNPEVTYAKHIWDFKMCRLAPPENPPHREAGRMVVLDLSPGLKEGDTIALHWGETTGSSGFIVGKD